MVKIREISIKGKLVLMQVFTSLLVLSIFFVVYVLTDIRDYKYRKFKSVIELAQVVAANNVSTIDFQDNDAAREILVELMKVSPDILYANILDRHGKIFASYSRPGKDSSWKLPAIANGETRFIGKYLYAKKEIFDNNELKGYVSLIVELSDLDEIKQSKYKLGSMLLLISIGFSALVGVAVQPYISKRLLLLVKSMKHVSRTGDYSTPVVDKGADEISTLFKSFNDLMQQVRHNEKKKDEFIGIASHELKTPLTSIKGYLELLSGIEDRQPNAQFVQKARENVEKLERLIKDLLDVSKIQSGQLQLNLKSFEMDDLLNETIASLNMISPTHNVIKMNDCGEKVMADRQRIEQVLVNLVSNAVKYSPGETEVLLYCEKRGSDLLVRVRDFGIGIPEEEQENVFKRFYRSKDLSVHISGFGLGLYICNDIINRHGGRIWVEKEDKGSSFYFSLPVESQFVNQ